MAPYHDYLCSSLFCAEDNHSIMGADDDHSDHCDSEQPQYHLEHHQSHHLSKDFLMGLTLQSDECLALMLDKETHHMPKQDYFMRLQMGTLDPSLRKNAIHWILKVHGYYKFGPLSAYLSVNYLDRFLSVYELQQGKSWMMQLLSVACLSIAAKMEEAEVPLSIDLQVGESNFIFEARTIQRMELLVLSTLRWRMLAVTPFSYIDYFLQKMNEGKAPTRSSVERCIELILSATRGVDMLEFRPSEVAAAVAICVAGETQTVDFNKAVSNVTVLVEKERALKCYELIQEMILISNGPVNGVSRPISCVPPSPVGVLDAASCLSYKSDYLTIESCENSHTTTIKRRKIDR